MKNFFQKCNKIVNHFNTNKFSLQLNSIPKFLLISIISFYPITFYYFFLQYNHARNVYNNVISYFLIFVGLTVAIINYLLMLNNDRIRDLFVPICSAIVIVFGTSLVDGTSKINTTGFEIWSFFKSIFSSTFNSILIACFFQFSLFIFYRNIRKKFFKLENSTYNFLSNMILTNVFFSLFSSTTWFKEFFWEKLFSFASSASISSNFIKFVASYFIIYFVIKSCHDIIRNKTSITLAFVSSILFAIIFNFLLQYGIRKEETLLGEYIFPNAIPFQIIILTLIFITVYLLINRYLLASILIGLVICVASIANDLKFEFRNEPLLFSDFIWLKDINLIFSFLNVKYLILFIFLVSFAIVLYLALFKTIRKKTIEKSLLKRLILLFIPIFIWGFIFNTFKAEKDRKIASNIPIISKLNNNYDIGWLSFAENARYKSVAYVWIKQITKPIIEKPNNYSKNTISSLVSKYTSIAEDINKIRTESISDQTVIFILSESFSDPSILTDISVSQDVIPNIRNIISQNTGGIMISDGYGGGTANMEFQALTGLAYRSFSDSVSIAYTEIVPKLSYIPSISNAFSSENRYVVHPASSTNYNRKNIYSTLDFKSFIAHINSDEPLENVEVVGANISDKTAYSNVLNHLDENNQFFSVITMQNHIPHVLDTPENISANGVYLSEEENATISSYARLISVTDDETRQFLEKLSEIDKKITVVFYGDHLPGIYPDYVFEENPEIQYMTDFFIWSNYQTNKTKFNRVYSSDFIAALFEHTNSKVTPYQALLTKVAEESNSSNDNGEALNDLRLLEYDLTEGKKYIQDSLDFFE